MPKSKRSGLDTGVLRRSHHTDPDDRLAAGIEPSSGRRPGRKDQRGRIHVDQYLRVKDRPGVYAVGDCTSIQYDGPSVPALAQAAEQEGKRAAANLVAEIKNQEPVAFRYRSVGQLVDLGEGSALVDILGQARWADRGVYLEGFTCTSWATTSIGRTYSPTGLSTCSAARTPPSSSKAVSGRILTPDASGLKLAHLRDAPPYCWRVCCHRAPPIEIAMRS